MSQKIHKHTSSSGKIYEIHGSQSSGYRCTDVSTGKQSVYATDSIREMTEHISKVEKGFKQDVNDFGNPSIDIMSHSMSNEEYEYHYLGGNEEDGYIQQYEDDDCDNDAFVPTQKSKPLTYLQQQALIACDCGDWD